MRGRDQRIEALQGIEVDVLVIGGGINGAVAAAAIASAKGKVLIVDREDFASGVSSQSSNLVWGGIKYLESGEFGLVWKLCQSRNRLLKAYPSRVREIRFLTSIWRGFRWPVWGVWLGALAYWVIGGGRMAPPGKLGVADIAREEPIIRTEPVRGGLVYSDAYLVDNDARFVFDFILTAQARGGLAANYVAVNKIDALDRDGGWRVLLEDRVSGRVFPVTARAIVNAAGPQVDALNARAGRATRHHHVFSKGIHLIVNRLTETPHVLTFFASDGRLFFVIPMGDKTCLGTTDTRVDAPDVAVSPEDREFVLRNVNARLNLERPLTEADIIAERVGVRPLAVVSEHDGGNWLQLSRRHHIDHDAKGRYLSIFGGKLTDCLNIGEEVVRTLQESGLPVGWLSSWYGEDSAPERAQLMAACAKIGLNERPLRREACQAAERLWRLYGRDALGIVESIAQDPSQGEPVLACADITHAELSLIAEREMIVTLDDLLRRRTLLSLTTPLATLQADPGLDLLCDRLFGLEGPAVAQAFRDGNARFRPNVG
jgi:glycerol-3-phosphate dehydrogenase